MSKSVDELCKLLDEAGVQVRICPDCIRHMTRAEKLEAENTRLKSDIAFLDKELEHYKCQWVDQQRIIRRAALSATNPPPAKNNELGHKPGCNWRSIHPELSECSCGASRGFAP